MKELQCFDCWIMQGMAGFGYDMACPKHATPEQRAAAERQILELANQPHPTMKMAPRAK